MDQGRPDVRAAAQLTVAASAAEGTAAPRRPPRRRDARWWRGLALQVAVLAAVVGLGAWLVANAMAALAARGIASGFAYLWQEAGFGIGEGTIAFSPSDTYLRALAVGLLNTLEVSAAAIVAATAIGFAAGALSLSRSLAAARLASGYVELFRNTPQLLQIAFWYALMTRLPRPRQAIEPLPGVFVSNRGLQIPWPAPHPGWSWTLLALALGAAAWLALRAARRRAGRPVPRGAAAALLLAPPLVAWLLAGAPSAIAWPALRGLNFTGGATLSPEFTALFLGLSLYIGAFLAEIVRGGLAAVGAGQRDAAAALGLPPRLALRFVVLPQALRIMVPPAAAQYVSLVKNSSLAVVIGYPDLVNVSNTTMNQTGHVIEAIAIMSAVYLIVSFAISALMNWYNAHVRVAER